MNAPRYAAPIRAWGRQASNRLDDHPGLTADIARRTGEG
jgi:hypothetical protein